MKKILTIIVGLNLWSSALAQNNPVTGGECVIIFNDNSYHDLDLHFTLFTTNPTTCTPNYQALGPSLPLPPGVTAVYKTYMISTTASGHPYPIDSWWNNSTVTLPSQIPQNIANDQRWSYMKFELRDPNNPGLMNPTLGGSVGFYQNCTGSGIPDYISGTSTLNGINYAFKAKAFTFGEQLWINVW